MQVDDAGLQVFRGDASRGEPLVVDCLEMYKVRIVQEFVEFGCSGVWATCTVCF